MTFIEAFEPDAGFRLSFDGRSILLQMTAIGERLNSRERAAMSEIVADFLAGVGNKPNFRKGRPRHLQADDFPLVEGEAYKVVTPVTEAHLRRGSFRLGAPTYYASLGADPGADGWEGYSAVFIDAGQRTVTAAVTAGYNCLAFCTTRARDRSRLEQLRRKFGGVDGRLIKVRSVERFAEALANKITCANVSIRDVKYSASNFIHLVSSEYCGLDAVFCNSLQRELSDEMLHYLNVNFSASIYRDALMGSLFTKPIVYAGEQERRILFEFSTDVPSPYYVDVAALEALEFLEFLD